MTVRVRMAPSPTGPFHVGGARTALFNWLFARRYGGRFILRIEDTDPERSSPVWVRSILEGLRWLGLDWDEGPEVGGDYGPYFQSQRLPLYREAAQRLLEEGKAYRCYCTPEELEAMRQEQRRRGIVAPKYDRRCRFLTEERRRRLEAEGRRPVLRLAMPEEGETAWNDLIRGPIVFQNQELQDVVLMKSDGLPTYNFAAVVDDSAMAITHVIRGEDHISNTPVQIRIAAALGYPSPAFAHLPLLLGKDRSKLSKRHMATELRAYAEEGYLPEAMFNFLALLGWAPGEGETQEIFRREELIRRFSLEGIHKAGAVFDLEKLEWMNGVYIRSLSPAELTERCLPYLRRAGLVGEEVGPQERAWLEKVISLEQERMKKLGEVVELTRFFFGEEVEIEPEAWEKWLSRPGTKGLLEELLHRLERLPCFDAASIEEAIRGLAAERGLGAGKVIHPTRVAVTGRMVGPGLFETMAVLGREKCLLRLQRTLERLKD